MSLSSREPTGGEVEDQFRDRNPAAKLNLLGSFNECGGVSGGRYRGDMQLHRIIF